MSEKEKAEAYVRSQIPELMELSFGCEVWIANDELWKLVGSKVTVGGGYRAYNGHTYIDVAELHSQIEKGNAEIIGHPIQLAHVLRLVERKEFMHVLDLWELDKPWEQQTSELYEQLCKYWHV